MKGFTAFYRYFKLREKEHELQNFAAEFSSSFDTNAEVKKLILQAAELLDEAAIEYSKTTDIEELLQSHSERTK